MIDFQARVDRATRNETVFKQLTFDELGVQTSYRVGRNLYDDFLTDLSGTRALKVYEEMRSNHPIISGILYAFEMLLREVSWDVKPFSDAADDEARAEFLREQMTDMSHTWEDHIAAVTTMIPFGFAPFEMVWRRRLRSEGSRYDDGKVGWRRFGFRPQSSIVEIQTDEHGGPKAIVQQGDWRLVTIPIEKALLYRTTENGGPTGRSLLRGAYTSWFYQKRALELMLIGLQRDLVGLPVVELPADEIIAESAVFEHAKKIATRTSVDELMGLVWPLEYDESGNRLYDIRLLQSGGSAKIDVRQVVRDFGGDIAATLLADFLQLGRDSVGSRALAEPKQELFQLSLDALADTIAAVLNRYAVPRLFAANGWDGELPMFVHEPVRDVSLADVGTFVRDIAGAGAPLFSGEEDDPRMMGLLRMAGLED